MAETLESNADANAAAARPLTCATLARFLIGNAGAILAVAGNRRAIWIGFLFVISAGFAREYDGEYLLAEPWHLLLPLGASLASSLVLYLMLYAVAACRRARPPLWLGYRSFLGLYWMTAPLAWLYAIPVERFLSAGDAMRVNLALLGLVSLWRVALMTRVVAVIFGCRMIAALTVVMLFADAVALTLLAFTPLPIFNLMGGIRMSESERVLRETACLVQVWGTLTLPLWSIGTLAVLGARFVKKVKDWHLAAELRQPNLAPASRALWALATSSLVAGLAILPAAQREQQNRWRTEEALRDGRVSEALQMMSALHPDDYPPHWDPPPRIAYGETEPNMNDVVYVLAMEEVADWVSTVFLEKIFDHAPRFAHTYPRPIDVNTMSDDQLMYFVQLLSEVEIGPAIAHEFRGPVGGALRNEADGITPKMSPTRRALLTRLLDMGNDGNGPGNANFQ